MKREGADRSRLYGEQHRALQDEFDTRKMADRVEQLVCNVQNLPSVGEVLAPILARVAVEKRPLLIAAAERMAAHRYRGWARDTADADRKAGLEACADGEEEIARRVESLFTDAGSLQRELVAGLPELAGVNESLFAPYAIEEQFRIQAQGERLGAATWRSFAKHSESERAAKLFESCAVLEEHSATFLESLLDSSGR